MIARRHDPASQLLTAAALSAVLLALATGCRDDGDTTEASPPEAEAVEATPDGARPAPATLEPAERLERAVGLTFGLPLPAGLALIERDEVLARFSSPHDLEPLTAFFDRELEGYRRVDAGDGRKYEPLSESGALVFVIPSSRGLEVVYLRGEIDLSALEAGLLEGEGAPLRRQPRNFAERYPWPQGPRVSGDLLEVITAEQAARPGRPGGGRYYEERFEEVDGDRVRILTLREQGQDDLLEGRDPESATTYPEAWHRLPRRPGGSYDRGDGERSLRPTPQRGPDGQPLPFYGTRRLDLGPRHLIPH